MPEHLPLEREPYFERSEEGLPARRTEERLENVLKGNVHCTPDGKCEVRDASGTLIYYEDQGAIANVLKRWSDSLTNDRRKEELDNQIPVEALDPDLREDLLDALKHLETERRGKDTKSFSPVKEFLGKSGRPEIVPKPQQVPEEAFDILHQPGRGEDTGKGQ